MHEIAFELAPADIEAWYLNSLDRTRAYRISYWACGLILAGLLAVGTNELLCSAPLSAIAAVAGFGIGWVLARASLRSQFRAFARERAAGPGAASQFGHYRLSVDSVGVTEIGPAAQHKHEWKAVEGLAETDDYLFLLIGGGSAYVIPKRSFDSDVAIEAFRTAVSEHRSQVE